MPRAICQAFLRYAVRYCFVKRADISLLRCHAAIAAFYMPAIAFAYALYVAIAVSPAYVKDAMPLLFLMVFRHFTPSTSRNHAISPPLSPPPLMPPSDA